MSFDGHSFSYGGVNFNLRFLRIKTSYQDTAVEASPKYKIVRMNDNKFHLQGRTYEDNVKYDVELVSDTAISDSVQRNYVKQLFNCPVFKKLQLTPLNASDTEYNGVFYRCVFTDETKITIGAHMYGWKCKMVCDAPFAWENDATRTITAFGSGGSFVYTNNSDDTEPLVPKIELKASASGQIKLQNTTTSTMLIVNGMTANEVLTIDKYGQMSSSMGYTHYGDWNKVMMLLASGTNNLFATNLSSVKITHEVVRRIGV